MILGLDISTAVIGYTFLDDKGELVDVGHIDMTKLDKDVWIKALFAKDRLVELCETYKPTRFFVEDPVKKFTRGKSRISTILLLAKFNALCSYFVMEAIGAKEPTYITAGHARKLCGIKIKRNGIKEKQQVFDHYRHTGPFKDKEWPLKRTGKEKDHCYDEVDSYVIARAGFVELATT